LIGGVGILHCPAGGACQADAPRNPTTTGQLSAVNMEKHQLAQIMHNGEVSPAPAAPAPAPVTP
ncbi:AsmA family protein, partial [Klebsiella pneumoniae]|nr:AsmA family protein [Klebsiella pneumoniae]